MSKSSYLTGLVLTSLLSVNAQATLVTVDSKAGPWDSSLNPSFSYGNSTALAPVSVPVGAGDQVAIFGATGLAAAGGGFAWVGPDGDASQTSYMNGMLGSTGTYFPSKYTADTWPTYLMALMGCFADSSGQVVGTPFEIGTSSLLLTAPINASQLLMGINDDYFSDNGGSYTVNVEVSCVPEPATFLAGLAILGAMGWFTRRNRP